MKRLLPLLLLLSSAALAESGAYRVEVIVFRNLAVTAEAAELETLRSFSAYPELVEPITPVERASMSVGGPVGPSPQPGSAAEESESPEGKPFQPARLDLPDDLRVILEKSRATNDAWLRLRGSRDYRPLLYAAWEQNRTDYYPPMRIHDQDVLDTQLRPPTDLLIANLTATDPLAQYRSTFYALDGSVQLRRSRFLHLYLDLEFREVVTPTEAALSTVPSDPVTPRSNAAYRVHSLKQNRQIRTGRMHYFDTPQFGVLVLVTSISPE